MRNLKRALSLTLASVMLLGMMVVGAGAASFPDVDENDNVEAIEVLNAVEVILGYDNGDFGPDDLVTRAQMAVIMAKLLNLDYQYYEAACPFTDVPAWARGYVGACYAKGIVSGYNASTYGADDGITPVQAASMMMRALGYFQYAEDYKAGFEVATVSQGTDIGIFSGVGSSATAQMTRNQVARMALNALRSNIVEFKGTPGIEVNGVVVGYRPDYQPRTSPEAKYSAIAGLTTDLATNNQYYIQLGEQLYGGKLRLINETDDFGRPARTWEYNGKYIGSYAKTEQLTKEYVGKVTGKDLYDLLGASTIEDYNLLVTIDGVTADASAFKTLMDKNNKAAVGATGTGVLTQVFTDNDWVGNGVRRGRIYVAIINTYLAQATKDYDEKKEELTVTIYGVKSGSGDYVKDTSTSTCQRNGVRLTAEDLPIVKGMLKDDFMLVNVAGDEVKIVKTAEMLDSVQVSAFQSRSNVTVDGQKYDFASAAFYDFEALRPYTGNGGTVNLKETTYNIYLDPYGNVLGIKEVEAKKNYVFITGIDNDGSNISNKTGKARALFLDGTSDVIEFNADKSRTAANTAFSAGALVNTWCTYTKSSSDVYTLTEVGTGVPGTGVTLGQWREQVAVDTAIDKTHITVKTSASTTYAYGNKDSVYLTAKLATVRNDGTTYGVINGVENVTVGAANASLTAWKASDISTKYAAGATQWAQGIYSLFNDKGIVIATVVVGEDSGAAKNLVYAHTSGLEEEAYGSSSATRDADGEWTWTRKVIQNGEEVLLTEKGDSSSYLEKMIKGNWYQVKLNSNGEVIDVDSITENTSGLDVLTLSGKTSFVADNSKIGEKVAESGVDTVLYCQRFAADKLTTSGWTLYVTTTNRSGFLVHEDAKIVLQQYDRNTQETYITEYVGADSLDGIVDEMNQRNDNKAYNYQVSAILESGVATSVVINSEVSDWTEPDLGNDGSVYLADNLVNADVGTIKNSKVEVDEWGEVRATFTLTKPEWAYATDAEGASAKLSYNVFKDGKAFKQGTSEITAAISSNYGYLTANGKTNDEITEFTGTYRVTKFLDLNGAESGFATPGDTSSYSIEITGIEWTNVAVSYVYEDGKTPFATVADTTMYVNNDGASKTGKVGFTPATTSPQKGTYTLSGVKTGGDVSESTWKNVSFDRTNTAWVSMDFTALKNTAITVTIKADDSYTPVYNVTIDGEAGPFEETVESLAVTPVIKGVDASKLGKLKIEAPETVSDGKAVTFTMTLSGCTDGVAKELLIEMEVTVNGKVSTKKTVIETWSGSGSLTIGSGDVTGNVDLKVTDVTVTPIGSPYVEMVTISEDGKLITLTFNKAVAERKFDESHFFKSWDGQGATALDKANEFVTIKGNVVTIEMNDPWKADTYNSLTMDAAFMDATDSSNIAKKCVVTITKGADGVYSATASNNG